MSSGTPDRGGVARVPVPSYDRVPVKGSTQLDATADAALAARRGRRRPASGTEADRRRQWGREWGNAGRNAGIAARQEQ